MSAERKVSPGSVWKVSHAECFACSAHCQSHVSLPSPLPIISFVFCFTFLIPLTPYVSACTAARIVGSPGRACLRKRLHTSCAMLPRNTHRIVPPHPHPRRTPTCPVVPFHYLCSRTQHHIHGHPTNTRALPHVRMSSPTSAAKHVPACPSPKNLCLRTQHLIHRHYPYKTRVQPSTTHAFPRQWGRTPSSKSTTLCWTRPRGACTSTTQTPLPMR